MKSRKEVNKICKDCECNNNGWCVMLETNRYEDKVEGCGILDDPTNFVDRVIRGEQEEVDEELDVELSLGEVPGTDERVIMVIVNGVHIATADIPIEAYEILQEYWGKEE